MLVASPCRRPPTDGAIVDLRIFTEPQLGTTYDQLRRHALVAEQAGFSGWFTSDHLLTMGGAGPEPGPTDAWTTLAGLARDTTTIRLGTLVTPATFRWPGHFAVQLAQVDQMSDGRIEVGIGSGWYRDEHTAMGIPFPDTGDRVDARDEYVEILHGLWSTPEGEQFSHDGDRFQLVDNHALPRAAQDPHPPLIIGGSGRERTPRIAARFADEYNGVFFEPDEFAEMRSVVAAACEDEGRDPGDLVWSNAQRCVVGVDDADFVRRAEAIGNDPDELRDSGVCGTPDEARARLDALAEAGCERVYLQTIDVTDLAHLELLATELL